MRRISPDEPVGFTPIELLTVIGIILILSAILFPVFARAREKARQSTCISNLKQLSTAALLYVADYDETMPNAQWIGPVAFPPNWYFGPSSRDLLQPYVKSLAIFVCPSDTELASLVVRGSSQPFGLSYQFNGNPLGSGNNIIKRVYFGDNSGKPMAEHNGAVALSYQEVVGQRSSPVMGRAMAAIPYPAQNWMFADAWPGVHGSEVTSYFKGTRTYMLADEWRPFRRSVNLTYVDGHAKFSNTVAAAWDTEPY
jgi:prepilin-type processing-associated H-X9-DG protein